VIALETNDPVRSGSPYKSIYDLPRMASTINVITEKDLNHPSCGVRGDICVDARKHLLQKICTTMNVADRIYPNTFGRPRCLSSNATLE
jgi:hypothetical protein